MQIVLIVFIIENLDDYLINDSSSKDVNKRLKINPNAATSVEELEQRMKNIKNKLLSRHKSDSSKADRIQKKKQVKLEKSLKKLEAKQKSNVCSFAKSQKNAGRKGDKSNIDDNDSNCDVKGAIIREVGCQSGNVFNPQSKLVYSKFDFLEKKKSSHQNPLDALRKLKEADKTISNLKEQGEVEKAAALKTKLAWKSAFEKIEGKKVKDDRKLLYKAIKARILAKKKSKAQWLERQKRVQQDINSRQKKRQENIDKRIKDKRHHKLKNAAKRGRIIPGF